MAKAPTSAFTSRASIDEESRRSGARKSSLSSRAASWRSISPDSSAFMPEIVHGRGHLGDERLDLIVQDFHRWVRDHLTERLFSLDHQHPLDPALVIILGKLAVFVAEPNNFKD